MASAVPQSVDDLAKAKHDVRHYIWDRMEELDCLHDYPRPCYDKIPNFKGCKKAASRVARLREFTKAAVIKVNPSLAQMELRYLILSANKILVVCCC